MNEPLCAPPHQESYPSLSQPTWSVDRSEATARMREGVRSRTFLAIPRGTGPFPAILPDGQAMGMQDGLAGSAAITVRGVVLGTGEQLVHQSGYLFWICLANMQLLSEPGLGADVEAGTAGAAVSPQVDDNAGSEETSQRHPSAPEPMIRAGTVDNGAACIRYRANALIRHVNGVGEQRKGRRARPARPGKGRDSDAARTTATPPVALPGISLARGRIAPCHAGATLFRRATLQRVCTAGPRCPDTMLPQYEANRDGRSRLHAERGQPA